MGWQVGMVVVGGAVTAGAVFARRVYLGFIDRCRGY